MITAYVTRRFVACTLCVGWAVPAHAQSIPAAAIAEAPRPIIIESTLPAWALRDLPSSGTIFSLLETVYPDVVSNRIEGGGMYPGSPAHIGAHGSSWTQTMFRVGDINISDPDGSGTPLALPGVLEWERIDVNTGLMGVEVNAPGMVLNLAPRRPSRTWIRQFDAMAGPPELPSFPTQGAGRRFSAAAGSPPRSWPAWLSVAGLASTFRRSAPRAQCSP